MLAHLLCPYAARLLYFRLLKSKSPKSRAFFCHLCATDDSTITLDGVLCDRSFGSNAVVSAKCPTWLVPQCISNPSLVNERGTNITPALRMRKSMDASFCSWRDSWRTLLRSARSSCFTTIDPLRVPVLEAIRLATASPAASSLLVMMTLAPAQASACTVSAPIPLFPPVTTAVLPSRLNPLTISIAVVRFPGRWDLAGPPVTFSSPMGTTATIRASQRGTCNH
mmetsp:Transcript_14543/g.43974  ORF Transcript_14543/g.43974 Transcript_14543/m.43974 type:complete len:224 (-) Transcript_14543:257-928(-)